MKTARLPSFRHDPPEGESNEEKPRRENDRGEAACGQAEGWKRPGEQAQNRSQHHEDVAITGPGGRRDAAVAVRAIGTDAPAGRPSAFPHPLGLQQSHAVAAKISAFSSAVSAARFTDSMVGTIDSVGPLSDSNRMRSAPNTFAASAMPRGPRPLWPVSR